MLCFCAYAWLQVGETGCRPSRLVWVWTLRGDIPKPAGRSLLFLSWWLLGRQTFRLTAPPAGDQESVQVTSLQSCGSHQLLGRLTSFYPQMIWDQIRDLHISEAQTKKWFLPVNLFSWNKIKDVWLLKSQIGTSGAAFQRRIYSRLTTKRVPSITFLNFC